MPQKRHQRGGAPLECTSILLIEDSEDDAILLSRMLRKSFPRAKLAVAAGIERAKQQIAEMAEPPDIVLTDLSLPDSHKSDAVEELNDFASQIPIVVLTGDDRYANEALRLGAQDYLNKSNLSEVHLAKSIVFALERKEAELQKRRYLEEIIAGEEDFAALSHGLEALLQSIVTRTHKLVPSSGAAVELPDGEDMVYRAGSGSIAGQLGLRLKRASSLSGKCLETGEIVCCPDVEKEPRADLAACRKLNIRSMVLIPLRDEKEPVGVIKALSSELNNFSETDVQALRVMGKFAERAIAQAQEFAEKDALIQELQSALSTVKLLGGLLPICANCKNIRDDKGYWNRVERYIAEHSEARFTHSICPACTQLLYGDFLGKSAAGDGVTGGDGDQI